MEKGGNLNVENLEKKNLYRIFAPYICLLFTLLFKTDFFSPGVNQHNLSAGQCVTKALKNVHTFWPGNSTFKNACWGNNQTSAQRCMYQDIHQNVCYDVERKGKILNALQ